MQVLKANLGQAVSQNLLSQASHDNIIEFVESSSVRHHIDSVQELVNKDEWAELNDRFFKKLSFGTSGLRGRTIGKVVTQIERGIPQGHQRPQHPCVGTSTVNYFNLSRATRGLVAYLKKHVAERPKIIFCHDTRHFSRDFAEFCSDLCTKLGCDIGLFDSFRPTPELSFAIRELGADAGIMHTASHNPAHDNGYKVYLGDGAGISTAAAAAITEEINAVVSDRFDPLPNEQWGQMIELGDELDEVYLERLKDLILRPDMMKKGSDLKIVFSALHGTGGFFIPRILDELGFQFATVTEQDVPDGRFPTVDSPNPENAAALQMGLDLAEKQGADIVMATDPDCDRLGVAARDRSGELVLLNGNQIGSLLAWYRIETLFQQGILNDSNKERAVLLKTVVTTDLQRAIAEHYGVRCVETLTGFKFMGQKLNKYEDMLPADVQSRYRKMTTEECRDTQLDQGAFMIFGGEESYGYLGSDFIRDKDGNMAVMMFAELAAYAKSINLSVIELMDEVYARFGYYLERNESIVFEGASGADRMTSLLDSYATQPPSEADGSAISGIDNYWTQDIVDSEGDILPKEKLTFFALADGRTFAVRPSGTEPKIKYYILAHQRPEPGSKFTAKQLDHAKDSVTDSVDDLWEWIVDDMDGRMD